MKRFRLKKPYGTNVIIKKVECTNHLLRNYINRLRNISGKRKNDKGDVIPGCYRKVVHDRLIRLRYAVTEAIKYRRLEQTDRTYEATLALLKADITNVRVSRHGFVVFVTFHLPKNKYLYTLAVIVLCRSVFARMKKSFYFHHVCNLATTDIGYLYH